MAVVENWFSIQFGTRFFLYLGVLGFGMLVLWAIQTEVEITATATGKVIPTGKVRMVQNLDLHTFNPVSTSRFVHLFI